MQRCNVVTYRNGHPRQAGVAARATKDDGGTWTRPTRHFHFFKMKNLPPPRDRWLSHQDASELPDFVCGRLIYYDSNPLHRETMRWVVYDGIKKVRCSTKQSAISYAVSQANRFNHEHLIDLANSIAMIRQGIAKAEKVANAQPADVRQRIERLTLQLRLTTDQLYKLYELHRSENPTAAIALAATK